MGKIKQLAKNESYSRKKIQYTTWLISVQYLVQDNNENN